jgi:hypothetical protein
MRLKPAASAVSSASDHDLAGHGVAEIDDRVDESALLVLDHVFLVRHVRHGLELGIGDVRRAQAVLPAARLPDDQVRQPDEQ